MKSLQIQHELPGVQARYGDLHVCHSGAGWFVGSSYRDPSELELGAQPGTRDTGYFATPADAAFALQVIERAYAVALSVRAKYPKEVDMYNDKAFSRSVADVLTICGFSAHNVGYRLKP